MAGAKQARGIMVCRLELRLKPNAILELHAEHQHFSESVIKALLKCASTPF